MKNIIKLLLAGICLLPMIAVAEEVISQSEIDLDSIKYNKSKNTAEIKMNINNKNYAPGQDDMYYATYYLKMYCGQRKYRPLMIEGYNKKDELMLVNYANYGVMEVGSGSDIEQAYNYACGAIAVPHTPKRKVKNNNESLY